MSWVRWDCIVLPKSLGGWGLKNMFLFSKALAGKVAWRLISTNSLWTRVLQHKYIAPLSMLDWIRTEDKKRSRVSIIWKAILQAFEVISKGLAWRVGDGHKLLIGKDPWSGSDGAHILSGPLCNKLELRVLRFLYQVEDPQTTTIWNQGWCDGVRIGLQGDLPGEWQHYTQALKSAHIRLVQREDEMI